MIKFCTALFRIIPRKPTLSSTKDLDLMIEANPYSTFLFLKMEDYLWHKSQGHFTVDLNKRTTYQGIIIKPTNPGDYYVNQ